MSPEDTAAHNSGETSRFLLSPSVTFFMLAAISVVAWWKPLTSTLLLALHHDEYTHILLILPVSVALLYMEWKSPEPSRRASLGVGSGLLGVAVLASVLTRLGILRLQPDAQLSLDMLALVIWWMGTFLLCFGVHAFQRALFPLCFLLWVVPIPQCLLKPIVRLLQEGSVTSAHLLFTATGVPVVEDGTLLTIPGLTVEVAPECSSFRSSVMLVVTTMVLVHVLLRSGWRKTLVIAAAIPLSVAKNGLRIFVLAMLATRVDRTYLTGRLHHEGGLIYFLIALAGILLLIWLVRRSERKLRQAATADA